MDMKDLEGMAFCQSCGMPMGKDEDHGTNSDGTINEEYCSYCYLKGEFTEPDITLDEMIELCSKAIADQDIMSYEEAKELGQANLPGLKRWK